jgi:hypothetical protein
MNEVNEVLDCHAAMRRLWEYLDGELSEQTLEAVHAHLSTCPPVPTVIGITISSGNSSQRLKLRKWRSASPHGFTDRCLRHCARKGSHPSSGSTETGHPGGLHHG